MAVVLLTLLVVGALTAILVGTTFSSGSDGASSSGASGAPGVSQAADTQAQQSLTQGLGAATSTVADQAGNDGVGGGVALSALSSSDPSVDFVTGPSTGPTTVSVTTVDNALTMADRSSNGTCWLVWHTASQPTWYGAQTDVSSCTAPALGGPPSPTPVSSSSIGWQQGSFPAP